MRTTYLLAVASGVALALACSATNDSKSGTGGGGGTGGGTGGGSGTGTGGSGGGIGATGGTGGGSIDAGLKDSAPSDAACQVISQKANKPAVDVIWLVDNSCSMTDEIEKVRTNINGSFVPIIDQSIIDWQVIMISSRGTTSQDVCVEPPLAKPNCANNPPKFTHISCPVGSSDSLHVAAASYAGGGFPPVFCDFGEPLWNTLARYDATKVFVEVTDDEADFIGWNADGFDNWALNLAQPPGMFGTAQARKYVFHGIIGMNPQDPTKTCNTTAAADAGADSGTGNAAVEPGLEYQKLAKLTGGTVRSICESDWSDIFNTIAAGIVNKLSCEYVVPPPKDGGTIDPTKVNVKFTPSGGPTDFILQDNNAPCNQGADGWQWDATKTKVLLCGATCDKVKADDGGQIDLEFGCETKVAPPPK